MTADWNWAELNDEQMELLKETEETLGADIVLAFKSGQGELVGAQADMAPAELDESQLECLMGAEGKMNAVLVAYRKES